MLCGLDVGLVVLAHGGAAVQKDFRARVDELGLTNYVLQIPFLPHWRVPEFLRGCLAVCCLEQDFPIVFHSPLIPREVLLCGTCLVGSTEVIRKLPSYERLPHGYGCVAIENVNDIGALSEQLAAIARNPRIARTIGARGCKFALELQRNMPSLPMLLQGVLEAAARREKMPRTARGLVGASVNDAADNRFRLTQLVIDAPRGSIANQYLKREVIPPGQMLDACSAVRVLANLEQGIADGYMALRPLAAAVRIEIALAAAEDDTREDLLAKIDDPLFRLQSRQYAVSDLAGLVPIRDPRLRIIEFDFDVSNFLGARTISDFTKVASLGQSYMIAFKRSNGKRREPLVVDPMTARILMLSNGTRTVADVVKELTTDASLEAVNHEWIENLFVCGLISLRGQFV
jgi:hypothetical protein